MKGISRLLIVTVVAVILVASVIGYIVISNLLLSTPNELVVGVKADPSGMDPAIHPESVAFFVWRHIHEGLLTWEVQPDGSVAFVPSLAESYEWINSTHIKFKLRENVKFHCGHELDAYAVNYSLNRLFSEWAVTGYGLGPVKYFTVLSKYEILVAADRPHSAMLAQMSIPYNSVVCPECAERLGEQYTGDPCGTGPYKFIEQIKGEKIVLEAFGDYWGGKPGFDRITFVPIVDDASRVIALEAGDVDMIEHIPPSEVSRLRDEGFNVVVLPGSRTGMISLNFRRAPFNDRKVRQAVNYLVERAGISDSLFHGTANPASSYLSPAVWGYHATEKYTYDVERAKQLLAEAGYPDGFEVTMWTFRGRYMMDKEVSEAVVGYLAEAGITVNLETYDAGTLYGLISEEYNAVWVEETKEARDYDMLFLPLSSMTLDPDYLADVILLPNKPYNLGDWENQTQIDLLDQTRAAFDQEARKTLFLQMQELVVEDAAYLFLYYEPVIVAMKTDVHGVVVLANEGHWLADAYRK